MFYLNIDIEVKEVIKQYTEIGLENIGRLRSSLLNMFSEYFVVWYLLYHFL